MVAIDHEISPRDSELAQGLIWAIESSPIEMFRPQLWRINLSKVTPDRWDITDRQDGWDEQLVKDLTRDEFEVMVE